MLDEIPKTNTSFWSEFQGETDYPDPVIMQNNNRVTLWCGRKKATFWSIPLEYIDVVRLTHTPVDVSQQRESPSKGKNVAGREINTNSRNIQARIYRVFLLIRSVGFSKGSYPAKRGVISCETDENFVSQDRQPWKIQVASGDVISFDVYLKVFVPAGPSTDNFAYFFWKPQNSYVSWLPQRSVDEDQKNDMMKSKTLTFMMSSFCSLSCLVFFLLSH